MEREKGIYDYDVETDGQTDVRREINRICSENGWNILMLQLSDLTLEDIFLKITMDEGIDSKNDKKKKAVSPKIGLKVDDKGRLNAVKEDEEKEEAEPEKASENEESNGGEE